jgi:two-component system, OmpR family, response regulator ChvI
MMPMLFGDLLICSSSLLVQRLKLLEDSDHLVFSDFPTIGCNSPNSSVFQAITNITNEVSFSGQRKKYCVCFIDMVNSTVIASSLTGAQIAKYYSLFLNSMSTIAKNFGANIIKNAGDCLIYYFPETSDSNNEVPFVDVLDCCITMIEAHRFINSSLNNEGLPSLNYRISADYGMMEIAKSSTSTSDDLFGSTMNRCAKINSKAKENGIVIGKELFGIVSSFSSIDGQYYFEEASSSGTDNSQNRYPIYSVQSKQKRIVLNPFKRVSARSSTTISNTVYSTDTFEQT